MALSDITTGLQTVTGTGAVTGSLDISGITGDYTLKIRVAELPAAEDAELVIEDTVDNFTASVVRGVLNVPGGLQERTFSFLKRDLKTMRAGTASAKVRINVRTKSASGNLKLHAWLET